MRVFLTYLVIYTILTGFFIWFGWPTFFAFMEGFNGQ